jgi:branched-chain amino acid transport system substrate-binding protein
MRRFVLLLPIVLLAASCVGGARPDEFVVGAVYPTGGLQGEGGLDEYRGVQLAAEHANDLSKGPPIRVVLEDAESADLAPTAVEELKARGAQVIVGSYGSTVSRPAAAAAKRLGLVFWETGAVGDVPMTTTSSGRFFRFPPTGRHLGREAIRYVDEQALPEKGVSVPTYAITYVDDVYGRAVAAGAFREVERLGRKVAVKIPYDLAKADFTAIARRVKEAKANVLFVVAYLDDGVAIRKAILRERVQLDANIGTSSSYCHPAFGKLLGAQAVGVFASDKPDADALKPEALQESAGALLKWARDEYRRRFKSEMSAASLSGFSAGWALFAHVLPEAKDFTSSSVAEAAQSVRIPMGGLPNGSGLQFARRGPDEGSNLRAASVIWEWVAPGQRAIVWPLAQATDPPRVKAG